MFKKPKSKEIMRVGKGLVAFEGGKRVGRGIVSVVPAKYQNQSQLIKGGLAVGAVALAAAYKGSHQDIVVPALVGLAAEQAGDLADAKAAEIINKKANPTAVDKFIYGAAGLGCPHDQAPPEVVIYETQNEDNPCAARLGNPTIQAIEWNKVYEKDSLEVGYAGA